MCQQCNLSGFATAFHRETNYLYAFRCNCDKGNRWSDAIPRWQNSYSKMFKADWIRDPKKPPEDYKVVKANPDDKPKDEPEEIPW